MKITKLIATIKQFLGPLICVAFGWLAFRWTAGLIAFAKLWPWCDCSLPPPPQTYIITVAFSIIGVCPLVIFSSFIYTGWRWFRTAEAHR